MYWFSANINHTLKRGYRSLQTPAMSGIRAFLAQSCQPNDGLFVGRSGHGDLYYTAFGLSCAYAAGLHLPGLARLEETLTAMPLPQDLVHWRARQVCHQAGRLLRGEWLRVWLPWPERWRLEAFLDQAPAAVFPHADRHAPYSQFLLHTLHQDNRWSRPDASEMERYACAEPLGAWSNSIGGPPSLNAVVAAVMIKKIGELAPPAATITWLQQQQRADGGFPAHPGAPDSDLLSTALALFTLQECAVVPNYPARDFIARHCLPGGSFTATDLEGDDLSDVEYTFYGLLASGSCHA